MSVEIVPAKAKDAPALAQLVNSAYRGDRSRQGWTTEADLLDGGRTDAEALDEIIRKPGYLILKYVDGGRLNGCMELHFEGSRLYLGLLTVRPHLQGRGIGKKLLEAAEAEARKQNCHTIYMTVISVRIELIDWYKRQGYADTGVRKPFSYNDPRFGLPKTKLEFALLEKKIL